MRMVDSGLGAGMELRLSIFSPTERRYLESLAQGKVKQEFDINYRAVLKHRIKRKIGGLAKDLELVLATDVPELEKLLVP